MKINTEPKIGKEQKNRPARSAKWLGFCGVILIVALLFNPLSGHSLTVPTGSSVTLAWSSITNSIVAGFNIYYGGASRNYTNKVSVGLTTNTVISGLVNGDTYYFTATTYAGSGAESAFCNEISYKVPLGPDVQLKVAADHQLILTVTGVTGHTYNIQATEDFNTWTDIGIVTITGASSLNFTDVNAPYYSQRFYRIQDTVP